MNNKFTRITKFAVGFGVPSFIAGWFSSQALNSNQQKEHQEVEIIRPRSISNRNNAIERFGLPQVGQHQRYESYTSFFDYRTRIPAYVLEHITADGMNGPGNRKGSKFVEDETIPLQFRPTPDDYSKMNNAPLTRILSRGHMAPAGNNKMSQEAMDSTFLLGSNILPQEYNQNAGRWNMLEDFTRKLSKEKRFKNVYAMSGPMFLPQYDLEQKRKFVSYEVIGDKNVAVPTHLYKVIAVEDHSGNIGVGAFVMPNEPIDSSKTLADFLVPVSYVESVAGVQVYPIIFGNKKCENRSPFSLMPSHTPNIQENLCNLSNCKLTSTSMWEKCNKFTAEIAKSKNTKELANAFQMATTNGCAKDKMIISTYKKKQQSLG